MYLQNFRIRVLALAINGIILVNEGGMKIFRLTTALILIAASLQAQDVFNPVKSILKSGDSGQLAKMFSNTVDVTLESAKAPYSKAQAEIIFRDFFRSQPPTEFSIIHTGSSRAGLKFAIGQYKSGSASYSVLIRMREGEKMWLIHEISFVKE